MIDARALLGTHDLLFITLDSLRYDAARDLAAAGGTPNLRALLPGGCWEERHSPATFTLPAHQAFFAGFLPTPPGPGPHPRLFAARFACSQSITEQTCVFNAPDIISGFADRGYHTACIGGVGFFNLETPLGSVLPSYFQEPHWGASLGVTDPRSTENQVALAGEVLERVPRSRRLLLFLNVSAIHQPNCFYLDGAHADSLESHTAALAYVDWALAPLFVRMRRRGPALAIVCSDHGTAYGEGGYWGHRVAHEVVWRVPYAEFLLEGAAG
jgi:hypothetical protein